MKFEEVLPALREGKAIRRMDKGWKNFHMCYRFIDNQIRDGYESWIEDIYVDDLLKNDWEVVKEKKKVKVRDLTEEQFKKYCKSFTGNNNSGNDCDKCVFHNVSCSYWYDNCWIKHKDLYSDKFLDQEIEIEE